MERHEPPRSTSLVGASVLERYLNDSAGFDIVRLPIVISLISAHDHVSPLGRGVSRNHLVPCGRLDATHQNLDISFQVRDWSVASCTTLDDNVISGKADSYTICTTGDMKP